ncbi:MAG: putative esterase [Bacteroidetes bacterium]|nr:MAG: putative esterase [Bacteroidota bacterium]
MNNPLRSNYKALTLQLLLIYMMILPASCQKSDPVPSITSPVYRSFESIKAFNTTWDSLLLISDSVVRKQQMSNLWDSLKLNKQLPFRIDDTVVFMYNGTSQPLWAGDFNGWGSETLNWSGKQLGKSPYWWLKKHFPDDARLDYKLVLGSNWILDPSNNEVQYSGFGPNSVLKMPKWIFPEETIRQEGVLKGTLSENQQIQSNSSNLNYKVNYRVYLPYNYASVANCPVIYVTDGHEYSDDRLGAMLIVLDNLIFTGKIEPVIAVFIDPRDPVSGTNRRMSEYRANLKFANFVSDELVPQIDMTFKTNPDASKRAILGTSLGGWNSAFFGLTRSDKFQLIGIHSPAFDEAILRNFQSADKLPLKVYMSTGTIFDTQARARQMRDILTGKAYPLKYKEVNEGHSWGNWRALIDEPLLFFYGTN